MGNVSMNDGNFKRFMVSDDRVSALIIAADYACVIGIAVLAVTISHPLVTIAAMALIAGRQVAFLNLVHAAAHHSLFSKKGTNDRVDLFVAYLIFDAVRPYRSYHLMHHREFNRKDPRRFEYLDERLRAQDEGGLRRTWEVIIKPLLGGDGISYIKSTVEQARENPGWTLKLGAYWIFVVGFFWWAGWLGHLLLYWIVPLLWLYPVFYNWGELSDHYAVKEDARNQQGLFYSLFLKGHEMYHAAHHKYPRIPLYKIKAASRHLSSAGETFEETRGVMDFVRILYLRSPVTEPSTEESEAPVEYAT